MNSNKRYSFIFKILLYSLAKGIRSIYNVVTKANDSVDLVFGDGNFADLPLGTFKTYYRIEQT